MKRFPLILAIIIATISIITACGSASNSSQTDTSAKSSASSDNSAADASTENAESSTDAPTSGADSSNQSSSSAINGAIVEAIYPVMAQYPIESEYTDPDTGAINDSYYTAYDAWLASRDISDSLPEDYEEGLASFYSSITRQFLADAGNKNRIISPLNIYLALGMLSEITDGDSRSQILSLLGAGDISEVRTKASALWEANYRDDGVVTSILANSLWLDEDIDFNQDTLSTLAVVYYASSYQGEMGSDEFTQCLRDWLSEQTGGLLKDQAEGMSLDPETVLALASTLYYKAAWADEFAESDTSTDTFHASFGDIKCDFMHQTEEMEYVDGANFTAAQKELAFAGDMWLILPDEDVSLDELINQRGVLDELFAEGDFEGEEDVTVNLSMPKFDVVSDINLSDGLKALGVTDIFDAASSDFSPMLDTVSDGLYVSQAEHAARVTVDEEGVEAAAYTVMAVAETALEPPTTVDFTLDRPFIFVITGEDDAILFAGTVNNTAQLIVN